MLDALEGTRPTSGNHSTINLGQGLDHHGNGFLEYLTAESQVSELVLIRLLGSLHSLSSSADMTTRSGTTGRTDFPMGGDEVYNKIE